MKKITCKEMGGCCDEEFKADTADELSEKGHEHVVEKAKTDEEHKKLLDRMSSMSEEDTTKWKEDFSKKFEDLSEA